MLAMSAADGNSEDTAMSPPQTPFGSEDGESGLVALSVDGRLPSSVSSWVGSWLGDCRTITNGCCTTFFQC